MSGTDLVAGPQCVRKCYQLYRGSGERFTVGIYDSSFHGCGQCGRSRYGKEKCNRQKPLCTHVALIGLVLIDIITGVIPVSPVYIVGNACWGIT